MLRRFESSPDEERVRTQKIFDYILGLCFELDKTESEESMDCPFDDVDVGSVFGLVHLPIEPKSNREFASPQVQPYQA